MNGSQRRSLLLGFASTALTGCSLRSSLIDRVLPFEYDPSKGHRFSTTGFFTDARGRRVAFFFTRPNSRGISVWHAVGTISLGSMRIHCAINSIDHAQELSDALEKIKSSTKQEIFDEAFFVLRKIKHQRVDAILRVDTSPVPKNWVQALDISQTSPFEFPVGVATFGDAISAERLSRFIGTAAHEAVHYLVARTGLEIRTKALEEAVAHLVGFAARVATDPSPLVSCEALLRLCEASVELERDGQLVSFEKASELTSSDLRDLDASAAGALYLESSVKRQIAALGSPAGGCAPRSIVKAIARELAAEVGGPSE